MSQGESPEEIEARRIVERVLNLELEHADRCGGVDYLFRGSDGLTGALEVTTVTSERTKQAVAAHIQHQVQRPLYAADLASSWEVVVDKEATRYRILPQRLEPALQQLESRGMTGVEEHRYVELAHERPYLVDALRTLSREHVVHAAVFPSNGSPTILVSTMGSYSASGSDPALALIDDELEQRPDNFKKLDDANVDHRHLFIWLDHDTPGEISRPFTGGLAEKWGHFGLPTIRPKCAARVEGLWIAHRGTLMGWRWTPDRNWDHLDAQDLA